MPRPLYDIAADIRKDWRNPYFGAVPYLEAMGDLDSISDDYGSDSGESIVRYFLTNASRWSGPTAKTIKSELNAMLKSRNASEAELRSNLIRLASENPSLRQHILPLLKEAGSERVAVTDETTAFTDWVIMNRRGNPWSERELETYLERELDRKADKFVKSDKPRAAPGLQVGDLVQPKPDKCPPQNQDVADKFKFQPCTVEKIVEDGVLVKFDNGQTAKFFGFDSGMATGLFRYTPKGSYGGEKGPSYEAVYFKGGKAEVEEYRKFMVERYISRGEAKGEERSPVYYSGPLISFKETKDGNIICTMEALQRPFPVTFSPAIGGQILYLGKMGKRPSWQSDFKRDVEALVEAEGGEAGAE